MTVQVGPVERQQDCRRTYLLEEEVQLRVGVGVQRDFEQRHEDVVQQLLKVVDDPGRLVHVVQPWQLQMVTVIINPVTL